MMCAHCCFSCSPYRKEKPMTRSTFINAIRKASEYGEYITIGGGEPTTWHELTWALELALGMRELEGITIITNGKKASAFWRLVGLKEIYGDRLDLSVSHDEYHELPPASVMAWAKNNNTLYGDGFLGDRVVCQGRAKKNGIVKNRYTHCICDDIFVKPDGETFQCGCKKSIRLGNVNYEVTIPENRGCPNNPQTEKEESCYSPEGI